MERGQYRKRWAATWDSGAVEIPYSLHALGGDISILRTRTDNVESPIHDRRVFLSSLRLPACDCRNGSIGLAMPHATAGALE
jgi:hypothetical protein